MSAGLLTPSKLGRPLKKEGPKLPDYDWDRQERFDEGLTVPVATSWTMNSRQTFDHNGKPTDADHDNNDD
jgi:hypothetical protein